VFRGRRFLASSFLRGDLLPQIGDFVAQDGGLPCALLFRDFHTRL
jgi:hypothetical protein